MPKKGRSSISGSKYQIKKRKLLAQSSTSKMPSQTAEPLDDATAISTDRGCLGQWVEGVSAIASLGAIGNDASSLGPSTSMLPTTTSENEQQRTSRLHRHALCMAAARTSENDHQRNSRLRINALRTAIARSSETEQQRSSRLNRNALRTAAARSSENDQQRSSRLNRSALRTSAARISETEQQRFSRLHRNAEAVAAAREIETENNRNFRLDGYLQYQANLTGITRAAKSRWSLKAFNYLPSSYYAQHSDVQIGLMNKICRFCQAKRWPGEPVGICCLNGKVKLQIPIDPPQPLRHLLTGTNSQSRNFLKEIRHYNCAFQMTSFGSSYKYEGGFMPTFKVQGQVYHLIGSLQPAQNDEAQFLQVYFMSDYLQQATRRNSFAFPNSIHSLQSNSRLNLILDLQNMLHDNNNYVRSFKYALESAPPDNFYIVIDADKRPPNEHAGRYNYPSYNEIAILLTGDQHNSRDIVIKHRENGLQRISETHRSYDALQYPLLFVYGEDGYHFGIPHFNSSTLEYNFSKTVSCKEFYAYRFMIRPDSFNNLHRSQDLFNQYATDMCAKMESERLCYIKKNQTKLRCDSYIHLRDGLNKDADPNSLGKLCILPSTFTGSPRYMHERTQDAMTIVRHYGRPDLFITFTCNPNWKEVEVDIFPGQTNIHRHDLLARVFHLKLHKLMDLIILGGLFGQVRGDMYTIEWQKRGLPHAHILIWLRNKISSNDIDKIISAELPDPSLDNDLYMKVTAHMIHGPCGTGFRRDLPCVKNSKTCTKRYPRQFIRETQTDTDGYPLYRRRRPEDGGFTARIKNNEIDNRWVVPYCPLLLSTFNAHINVEFCSSVQCIKYICKYINKGSDAACFGLLNENTRDEVTQYQVGRYISSSEAFWRIFGFPIHDRHPTIQRLDVHLENGQRVYYTAETAVNIVQTPRETTLTAFFKLCQSDDFAKTLLYSQVPSYYTWNKKIWSRRKNGKPVDGVSGIRYKDCLGRVYTIPPNQHECFYLRILLHEVKGPTSFESLRTFGNRVWPSYREACLARGLLEDDSRWDATLAEIATSYSAGRLRNVFVKILQFCSVSDAFALWLKFRNQLSEDFLHQAQLLLPNIQINYCDELYNKALIDIEDNLILIGGKTLPSYGLPQTKRAINEQTPTLIIQETSYDVETLSRYVTEMEPKLLPDQLLAFNTITNNVFNRSGGIFFLDAPGGTGKTFVNKLILAKVRLANIIAIAVASSGIAATILPGGRTAHSMFKLPLNLISAETPLCGITKDSPKAQLLRQAQLIVWDECTMAHKGAIEALDRTLRDIRDEQQTMGGLTLLLSGDFRQTLPVVPKGTRADQVHACLKSSKLWRQVKTLRLTTNMRVRMNGDGALDQFSENILNIGDGNVPADTNGDININNICGLVDTVDDLITSVFPNLVDNYLNHEWLCERAILAPINTIVRAINCQMLDSLPGPVKIFKSINTNVDPLDDVRFPLEFLNNLDVSGLPDPILTLKKGCPVILLRNIAPPKLCNGTRLVVNKMSDNIIDATIITGCGKGEDVLIPKVMLITSATEAPYVFKRIQFPFRVAFAMSINKSQGQTLSVAGLHLKEPCFSHGQLYVGCSRVGSPSSLFAFIPNSKTKNVVYNEVL